MLYTREGAVTALGRDAQCQQHKACTLNPRLILELTSLSCSSLLMLICFPAAHAKRISHRQTGPFTCQCHLALLVAGDEEVALLNGHPGQTQGLLGVSQLATHLTAPQGRMKGVSVLRRGSRQGRPVQHALG